MSRIANHQSHHPLTVCVLHHGAEVVRDAIVVVGGLGHFGKVEAVVGVTPAEKHSRRIHNDERVTVVARVLMVEAKGVCNLVSRNSNL